MDLDLIGERHWQGLVFEVLSLGLKSTRVREASGRVVRSQFDVMRPSCGGVTMSALRPAPPEEGIGGRRQAPGASPSEKTRA